MIYIGIVGSRQRSERKAIRSILNNLSEKFEITLVSGGAKGIDTEAEQTARAISIPTIIYRPKKEEYSIKGNDIYFERNAKIAQKVDYLFAFPLNRKGGTMNTIKYFQKEHGRNTKRLRIID